jgi:hypothetical protein
VADFDVVLATKWKNEKSGKEGTSYTTVGSAFALGKGGYAIRPKHAVVMVPGVTELMLFPPKTEGESTGF